VLRFSFYGANNTSLLVMVANLEGKYEALEKYGIDLTKMAKQGKLDLVIGRGEEIRRCIQIMSQRTKNNHVLINEPSVGKTTIVEGSIFHLQCLLQTVCRLWNWDMYIK
jgi:ATP-dependent Clp protease ATP-binding subunit ClpA